MGYVVTAKWTASEGEAAYKAHGESAHFAEHGHGHGHGIPRLDSRERVFYTTIDP